MDVGKLLNHVNIVLCVWLFSLACVFSIFLFLTGWEFGLIPYTGANNVVGVQEIEVAGIAKMQDEEDSGGNECIG